MLTIQNFFLETSKNPLSICHITDIHYSKNYPRFLLNHYLKEMQKHTFDAICVTGDLLDDALVYQKVDMKPFYDFFKEMSKMAPVICIVGNHDQTIHSLFRAKYHDPKYLEFTLKRFPGVYVLHNEIYEDEKAYYIGYVGNPRLLHGELKKEKQIVEELGTFFPHKISSSKTVVLLSHSPLTLASPSVQEKLSFLKGVDVILSGHTHDGLCPLATKGNHGLISPNKKLFPKNVHGLIRTPVPIVISGGVMKLSRVSGIFRYFNHFFPSSMTFVEIRKKR